MKTETSISYQAQWKELLVGTLDGHKFTVEMTMGILHVYFPDEATWDRAAPDWAKGKWNLVSEEAKRWCAKENIPISFDQAWVEFLTSPAGL